MGIFYMFFFRVMCIRPLQKASLKCKTIVALKSSRKLAGAIDELARTIGLGGTLDEDGSSPTSR